MTSTTPPPSAVTTAAPHTRVEDALALLIGTFVVSLGLHLLRSAELVTGGTAGLSLLIDQVVPIPFAWLFLLVNTPFFLLGGILKGWTFAAKTVLGVGLVSAFSALHPHALPDLHPGSALYAAVAGNLLCGIGMLILFRHGSSLGGFNVMALLAQERLGLNAGYVQMTLDVAVVIGAFTVASPTLVLCSAVGAVVMNIVIALNHRPGRYLGM
ncbi:YitT family protein [Aeromicrobium massiliense]|uniref:YitT family protein n=1 Tax=Aeromicrobium massiliense TaxID=1464554 RepID=UPI000317EF6C|nr:YitT family protein [Aeromicrobium massiliense]